MECGCTLLCNFKANLTPHDCVGRCGWFCAIGIYDEKKRGHGL